MAGCAACQRLSSLMDHRCWLSQDLVNSQPSASPKQGQRRKETTTMTSNNLPLSPGAKAISYPRFAAFYNRIMKQPQARRQFDPLRREIVGQAHGVVLEVGAGGGQNFPFYDPRNVVRVEAIEPDEAMQVYAESSQADAPIPIQLSRAAVEWLPFSDASFDS